MDNLEFLEKKRDNLQARILDLTSSTIAEYTTEGGDTVRQMELRALEKSLDETNEKIARLNGHTRSRRASFNRGLAAAAQSRSSGSASGSGLAQSENSGSGLSS